ncbi:MAG: heavy metal-binding domain-containing protein [Cyanobacteria bacterium J06597_1]
MADLIFFLIFLVVPLTVYYAIGSTIEKKSYASIRAREAQTIHIPTVTYGAKQPMPPNVEAALFVGSVVVSADAFKVFVANLRNLVGGRITVYESVVDRGRREAVLRMKEQAMAWGANQMVNVRIETSDVGNKAGNQGIIAIEAMAYGTAFRERQGR